MEETLEMLKDYIEEQKEIECSIDRYASSDKYDFAIELIESFAEQEETK